jgi:hypothetical protein
MSQYSLKREDAHRKHVVVEVNFKEKIIVREVEHACMCTDEIWNGIILAGLGQDWHDPDVDELEYFQYWSDGSYICQKRRLRTDSSTGNTYWKNYAFRDATEEEAERVANIFAGVFTLAKEEKRTNWIEEGKEFFDQEFYYEAKYVKYQKQVASMLLYSDWRMLPDIEEAFEGELEMWKEWRRRLRGLIPKYETFATPYDAFKHVSLMKYPIDPKMYIQKYPNRDVEYLSTEDQFEKLDFKASSDYVAQNVENISDFVQNWVQSDIIVTEKVYKLIQELEMFDFFPELNSELVKPEKAVIPEQIDYPE